VANPSGAGDWYESKNWLTGDPCFLAKHPCVGLEAAARSFCVEGARLEHVQIDFHSENIPKGLAQEIALSLFRVLQEALQNAIKHSGSP
jgi:signal transduction histidine kinase